MCKTCKLDNLIFAYVRRFMRDCKCYFKLMMEVIIIFELRMPRRVLSSLKLLEQLKIFGSRTNGRPTTLCLKQYLVYSDAKIPKPNCLRNSS